MSKVWKLFELATARSGDKGNHVNIGVVARDEEAYALLVRYLTASRVARHFGALGPRRVRRFLLPKIGALNFVLYDVLDGGASMSLRSDTQGKLLGAAILEMTVVAADEIDPDGA